jgi:serine/threonine protein kinase
VVPQPQKLDNGQQRVKPTCSNKKETKEKTNESNVRPTKKKERRYKMARWKVAFDELSLEKRIGKGNFGEVWVGKYLGLDVAIKRLFFTDDEFMQKYIEREMDTLTYVLSPPPKSRKQFE